MEVWGWLAPWWNWWAGFTDLFDWEALAAIATAWAVIVALSQAGRVNRMEARHGVGVLTVLIAMLEPISAGFYRRGASIEIEEAASVSASGAVDRAMESMDRISALDIKALGISEVVGGLPHALAELRRDLPSVAYYKQDWRILAHHVDYIGEVVDELKEKRVLLQRGEIAMLIGRHWRRARRAFASLRR